MSVVGQTLIPPGMVQWLRGGYTSVLQIFSSWQIRYLTLNTWWWKAKRRKKLYLEYGQVCPSRRPSWSSLRRTDGGSGGWGFLVDWDLDPGFSHTLLAMWRFLVPTEEKVVSQLGHILSVSIVSWEARWSVWRRTGWTLDTSGTDWTLDTSETGWTGLVGY